MFAFLTPSGAKVEDLFGSSKPAGRPSGSGRSGGGGPEPGPGDAAEAAQLMSFWTEGDASLAPRQVKPLDEKGFDALLAKGDPAELQAYYAATTDPARKVKL